jgi:putative flippase GtrA
MTTIPRIDARGTKRFAKYASVGVSTFLFDLALLFLFIDFLGMHHVVAAGAAFLIAVSCNFLISRRFVFQGTSRPPGKSYAAFLLIAGTGLVAVAGLMYVAVDLFGLHYLVSRVLIAGVVGMWNYLMNLYMNFKVVGQ